MLEVEIVNLIESQQRRINGLHEMLELQSQAIHELMSICTQLRYRIEQLERVIDTQD